MEEKLRTIAEELVQQNESYIIGLRREFHMYPEVSLKEERTSQRIQEELAGIGIPYAVLSDGSVIGTIEGGEKGRVLAIRGDIDALPMQEENDLPYKSKNDGAMHACGHDAHAAVLLGVAKTLLTLKDNLRGTVKLVFQVGEEIGKGHTEILKHFKEIGGVDRIIATHVWAGLEVGTMSVEPGPRMAGAHSFRIEVTGRGGHGSRPDQSISPIFPLCDIVMKLPLVAQYFHNALETSIVSVGMINAGTQSNIIPDTASAVGGVRFFSWETQKAIENYMRRLAENIAAAYGAEAKLIVSDAIAPVVNDEETVKLAQETLREMDSLKLVPFEQICASDCYGMLLQEYPGCYCYIGIRNEEKGIVHPQHSTKYDIDECVLRPDCEFLSKYALKYLS